MRPEAWELAKQALAAALEAPQHERTQIIARLCADNHDARAEAQRMLAHAGPDHDDPTTDTTHTVIVDRFRIIEEIGAGATGKVYRAYDPLTERDVAIKVLRYAADSPATRRRVVHEGEILATFEHPGIARVYEVGTARTQLGPFPFIALECIDGRPINAHAESQQLDDDDRLALMARVCDAVAYAHRRGIIHRDIKPGNILVDPEGQPKLLDFGLACPARDALDLSSIHTQSGAVLGTPGYMSPEQARGHAADTRADVYALGVLLYELLTRERLFHTDNLTLLAALELLQAADPPLLGSHHPRFRGPIEAIVTRAMHPNPNRRYDTAAGLADDLHRLLQGETVLAEPVSGPYRLRRSARKHRRALAAVSALALVLAIALAIVTANAQQANHRNTLFEHAVAALTTSDPEHAADAFDRLAAEQPIAHLDPPRERLLLDAIGGRFQLLGDPHRAAHAYAMAFDLAASDPSLPLSAHLRAAQTYAEALAMADKPILAIQIIDEAFQSTGFDTGSLSAPNVSPTEHQRLLRLAMTRGEATARAGHPRAATDWLRRVEAAQRSSLGSDASDVSDTHALIAWIVQSQSARVPEN